MKWKDLEVIISTVNGCAAQYCSDSVCYELCQLAAEFGIVYNCIIQASGYGKCVVDSQSGLDKTLLDQLFNCLIANLEEMLEGMKSVFTHDRDKEAFIVSLAEGCYKILSDPDCVAGAKSHKNRAKNRKINRRSYFILKVGEASGEGLKYACKRFEKGDHNDVRAHYNIRVDSELLEDDRPNDIVRRCFPCCYQGFLDKLKEPIQTWYTGPSNICE